MAQGSRQRRLGRADPGVTARPQVAEQVENAKLKARAERAERELAKTKAALEIVGKAHALLAGLPQLGRTRELDPPRSCR